MGVTDFLRRRGLEVAESPKKGRLVRVVGEAKPAGAEVMRSTPFAYVLHRSLWDSHCASCFETSRSTDFKVPRTFGSDVDLQLRGCGRCKLLKYCDSRCQLTDWDSHHKTECAKLKAFVAVAEKIGLPEDEVTEAVLLGRTVRRIGRECPNWFASNADGREDDEIVAPTADSSAETDFSSAASDVAALCAIGTLKPAARVTLMAARAGKFVSSQVPIVALERLLLQFQCNNFEIWDSYLVPVGFGVYPLGSLLNHDCTPNCVVSYDTRTHVQIIRTLRTVDCEEELCHVYTEIAAPTNIRKGKLLDTYGFECECDRCKQGMHISFDVPTSSDNSCPSTNTIDFDSAMLADAQGVAISASSSKVRETLRAAEEISKEALCSNSEREFELHLQACLLLTPMLHPLNLQLYVLRGRTFSAALAAGRYLEACHFCEQLVGFLRSAFLKVGPHPLLGLQLYTLGDLYEANGKTDLARKSRQESYEILRVGYGVDHEFVCALATILGHS